ncbi:uncharacterized protein UV8b_03647 [Ustilaginoidea virens]|uniref:Fcf2 pre-rRNA processing C-terminal domain-containing protein n=1 Tax=Ustilaginoidea virens TaxID=1159556 RepID=A0A8E5HPW2_USTVR|nr:uncharacterized protein UV8b_03647 [Ustilaginoidea virens]QUC19406.1 hypothetical protein UV8b_03647 [Ustilaginoidea virens]
MCDSSRGQILDLLRQAEERLESETSSVAKAMPPTTRIFPSQVKAYKPQTPCSIRNPHAEPVAGRNKDETAGSDWFNLPKTKATPAFKREWQLLRMRGLLDPKHQKKAMRFTPPEYSQVGTMVAGHGERFGAKRTRREGANTFLNEVIRDVDGQKLQDKYASIQRQKASGKKSFYQRLTSRRKRRH